MNRTLRSAIAAAQCLFIAAALYSESGSYQGEGGLVYNRTMSDDMTMDMYALGGRWYFTPVQTDNAPFREAWFVNKNPWAGINVGMLSMDIDTGMGDTSFSGMMFGAGGAYLDPELPFGVSMDLTYASYENDDDSDFTGTMTSFNLLAAYFIDDPLAVGLDVGMEIAEMEMGSITSETNTMSYSVFGKYVIDIVPGQQWVSVEASIGMSMDSNDDWDEDVSSFVIDLTCIYYPMNNIGVGLSLSSESGEDENYDPAEDVGGTTFGVLATYDHETLFGVQVSYESFSPANDDEDSSSTIGLEAMYRF